MGRIIAFAWGMIEFRSLMTRGYYDTEGNADARAYWYDWGRDWAHRLTFRRFEP
jgi:hypothetical protein